MGGHSQAHGEPGDPSSGSRSMTGPVVSTTVSVEVARVTLPHSSVAVKGTVVVTPGKQPLAKKPGASSAIAAELHRSTAAAVASHACTRASPAGMPPSSEHSSTIGSGTVSDGGVVSATTTGAEQAAS